MGFLSVFEQNLHFLVDLTKYIVSICYIKNSKYSKDYKHSGLEDMVTFLTKIKI